MAKIGRLVKDSMIKEIASGMGERPNLFVTSVKRLSAADSDVLRQKLFGAQARLRILKRTLGLRLLKDMQVDGLTVLGDVKNGSLGFVVAQSDALPVAKHLVDFIKDHADHLTLQGGFVEGQVFNKQSVEVLASLPPKPQLLAQVVMTLESPIADVAFTIERIVGDVCWNMEQLAAKKTESP